MLTPPAELNLGSEPMLRISVFMNFFNCHVNRAPMHGRIVSINYRSGSFFNAELERRKRRFHIAFQSFLRQFQQQCVELLHFREK
ncbi:phosphatidylserine decarboxylase, partial [Rhizobium johnstonii]|uniref:phosphatidylserine decarboxylase n=1 Tax=Rhizobium johnstonii TaxID=3019933 RepID=UPI003F9CF501